MGEGSMSCEEKNKPFIPFINANIHVLGLGAAAIPVFQSVRSDIEEKNQDRQYPYDTWWLWSFSQVPSSVELAKEAAQKNFGTKDIIVLLVDTADKMSVQHAERIGQCENPKNIGYPIIIAFLLGDGEQDARERIASAVGCFVDLRNERLKQYKKQEPVKQLVYIFVSSMMATFEEQQLVSTDLEDVQQLFSHSGEIHFVVGHAVLESPEDDVCRVAAKEATRELEAQCNLRSIRRAFLSIENSKPSLYDLALASEEILALMDDDCFFWCNTPVIPDMKEHVRAVLFATEAPITKAKKVTFIGAGRDDDA